MTVSGLAQFSQTLKRLLGNVVESFIPRCPYKSFGLPSFPLFPKNPYIGFSALSVHFFNFDYYYNIDIVLSYSCCS
jgi:hypothetical protein